MNEILDENTSSEIAGAVSDFIEQSSKQLNAEEILDFMYERTLKELSQVEYDYLQRENSNISNFLANNKGKWGKVFKALKVHHGLCRQAGVEFVEERKSSSEYIANQKFGLLIRFHAKSTRIFEEVIWLLEGGFPDAAYSRWRTMLEIAVLAITIRDNEEATAIEYIKYCRAKRAEALLQADELSGAMNHRSLEGDER